MQSLLRLRSAKTWLILCLVLCTAFIGTAVATFASGSHTTRQPHISVTPTAIFTDSNGCGTVKVSGQYFQPETTSLSNTASLTITQDFGTGSATITPASTRIDAKGRIAQDATICSNFAGMPDDVFTICAQDNASQLTSNCVNVNANTVGLHMPHLSVKPNHITTNISGCGSINLTGTGYTPSSNSTTNVADVGLSDDEGGPPSNVYFQQSLNRNIFIPIDSHGNFTVALTVCDIFGVVPTDTYIIGSFDTYDSYASNTVLLEAR